MSIGRKMFGWAVWLVICVQVVLITYLVHTRVTEGAFAMVGWKIGLALVSVIVLPLIFLAAGLIGFILSGPKKTQVERETERRSLQVSLSLIPIQLPTSGPYPSPQFDACRRRWGPLTSQEVSDLAKRAYMFFDIPYQE